MLGRRRIQLVTEAGFLGMKISLVLGMEVKELKDHDDEWTGCIMNLWLWLRWLRKWHIMKSSQAAQTQYHVCFGWNRWQLRKRWIWNHKGYAQTAVLEFWCGAHDHVVDAGRLWCGLFCWVAWSCMICMNFCCNWMFWAMKRPRQLMYGILGSIACQIMMSCPFGTITPYHTSYLAMIGQNTKFELAFSRRDHCINSRCKQKHQKTIMIRIDNPWHHRWGHYVVLNSTMLPAAHGPNCQCFTPFVPKRGCLEKPSWEATCAFSAFDAGMRTSGYPMDEFVGRMFGHCFACNLLRWRMYTC